jgi:hypothetical protein
MSLAKWRGRFYDCELLNERDAWQIERCLLELQHAATTGCSSIAFCVGAVHTLHDQLVVDCDGAADCGTILIGQCVGGDG